MKNRFDKLSPQRVVTITLLVVMTFHACKQDNVLQPSIAEFSLSEQNVPEGGEAFITLSINKGAPDDGSIHITTQSNADYTTDPASDHGSIEIAVVKGQTSAQFKVMAIDNALFENGKFILFTLTDPAPGLRLGNLTRLMLTIDDDERPSVAGFAVDAGTVAEDDANGIVVEIPLSCPAAGTGTINVSYESDDYNNAVYGVDFTIVPAPTGNSVTLPVARNANKASLKILPLYNAACAYHYTTLFISSVTGVVEKGNPLNYTVTIKDNGDESTIVTFAERTGTVGENNTSGIVVHLNLSRPAIRDASIFVMGPYFDPDYDFFGYTTMPEMVPDVYSYYVPLEIKKDVTHVEFTIKPIDNAHKNNNSILVFYLVSNSPCLPASGEYDLTIVDDD